MRTVIHFLIVLSSWFAFSQQTNELITDGNAHYTEKKYTTAESKYRAVNAKNPKHTVSAYNLGTTIYKQEQHSEAKSAYKKVIDNSQNKKELHQTFHNLGNIFMKEKKYAEAVAAYKDALRNDPTDEETRYNLALAKELLKKNPPKQDKKDENKKDKDKNKENEKDKKENEKDPSQKDKKDENQNKEQPGENKKPEPQEGKYSKQRMESLLEAINNEEKKVQKKINKQKVKGSPIQQDKNW